MLDEFLPIVRHMMQIISGYLVAKGIVDEGTAFEITGLVMSTLTFGWFFWERRKKRGAE